MNSRIIQSVYYFFILLVDENGNNFTVAYLKEQGEDKLYMTHDIMFHTPSSDHSTQGEGFFLHTLFNHPERKFGLADINQTYASNSSTDSKGKYVHYFGISIIHNAHKAIQAGKAFWNSNLTDNVIEELTNNLKENHPDLMKFRDLSEKKQARIEKVKNRYKQHTSTSSTNKDPNIPPKKLNSKANTWY